jgi:hypothetical protein
MDKKEVTQESEKFIFLFITHVSYHNADSCYVFFFVACPPFSHMVHVYSNFTYASAGRGRTFVIHINSIGRTYIL